MTKKIYLETLKSVLGRSILHYSHQNRNTMSILHLRLMALTNGLKTNKPKTNIFHTSITSWKATCYRLFGNFGNFFNDYFSQKYTAIENDSSIPPYKTFETEQNCLLLDSAWMISLRLVNCWIQTIPMETFKYLFE